MMSDSVTLSVQRKCHPCHPELFSALFLRIGLLPGMIVWRFPRAGGAGAHRTSSVGFLRGCRMRWGDEDPKRDPVSVVADGECPLEVTAHEDARLGVADAVGIGEELQVLLRTECDGIVIGRRPLIGKAADVVEVKLRWQRSIGPTRGERRGA